MTTTNFIIGPVIKDGLRKDLKPFATPEDSFEVLENALQFRGRIIRKPGYTQLGRLANGTPVMGLRTYENFGIDLQTLVAFDTTQAYEWNGTTFIPLPSVMPVIWSGTDYQFFWTINYANAFWATNSKPGLNGFNVSNAVAGAGFTTITTTLPNGFTSGQSVALINLGGMFDLNGNVYVITVTGPNTFTVPFQSAGTYTVGGIALNSEVAVTGQDGIRYYGILTNGTGWANYNPPIDPNTALAGCLLIFAYRGYLVFLNTWEGNDAGVLNYPNRARWTQIGTPYYSPPAPSFPNPQGIDPNTARDDLFGRGGANDAPTNETIVAAAFIRDILVVYFERSTWRLRFVNNAQNPFVWERINIELGSECTFSAIPFDKGLMTIGNRGIVISDGNDTMRIDDKIPDDAFDIRQSNFGFQRVYGIRTFRTKLNFWTYPTDTYPDGIYPDRVLVFNYETKNWSYFDDSFTCFGYYYQNTPGQTWQGLTNPWADYDALSWNSGVAEVDEELIVAGNAQGYVMVINEPDDEGDSPVNDPSLAITAIANTTPAAQFSSLNNNLPDGAWVTLSGITGTTETNGVTLNGRNFQLSNPTYDATIFTLSEYKPIDAGAAVGTAFGPYTINYQNILAGSAQIYVGSIVFNDPNANGILIGTGGVGGSGTIDYLTGTVNLTFDLAILTTEVYVYVVSLDPSQGLQPLQTSGAYGGGGEIAVISNFSIQSKIFNFFQNDKRARLSKIDFYTESTANGAFTVDILADSSNVPVNTPLPDNPFQNWVLTSPNPYQVGQGDQAIYRLYCDAIAQTLQFNCYLSNEQMAVNAYNGSDVQLLSLMVSMRQGGRLQ